MCECKEEGCCSTKGCCCETSCGHNEEGFKTECEVTNGMMKLANEAWGELLKEKMKKVYDKKNGEHMNKLAEVLVDTCTAYWHGKMQEKAKCAEFTEKIKQAMMG
jgi:hypothetical protein